MTDLESILGKAEIRLPKRIDFRIFKKLAKYLCKNLDYKVDYKLVLSEHISRNPRRELTAKTSIVGLKGTIQDYSTKAETCFECNSSSYAPILDSITFEVPKQYDDNIIKIWDSVRKAVEDYFSKKK